MLGFPSVGLGFISGPPLESFSDLGDHVICISLFIDEIETDSCHLHTSLDCRGSYELVPLQWVAGVSHAGMRCPRGISGRVDVTLTHGSSVVLTALRYHKASSVSSTV